MRVLRAPALHSAALGRGNAREDCNGSEDDWGVDDLVEQERGLGDSEQRLGELDLAGLGDPRGRARGTRR